MRKLVGSRPVLIKAIKTKYYSVSKERGREKRIVRSIDIDINWLTLSMR